MKLFCIPGGGTPATVFYKWKAMLKKNAEVIILNYPDRDISVKNHSLNSVRKVAEFLFETVKAQLNSESYALLSSCTGTMIEYELYRIIEEQHLPLPEKFIVFSAFALDTDYYAKCSYISEQNLPNMKGIYASLFKNELFSDPESAAEHCAEYLIHAGTFPPFTCIPEEETYEKVTMLEFANQTISMILYDWKLASSYLTERTEFPKIQSDIYAVHGTEDHIVSEENTKKWSEITQKSFTLLTMKGDHNIITNQSGSCIEMIKTILER